MPDSLRRVLNVQPGEGRLTLLLFAEFFLLGVAFNFVETSVFPLFLSEYDSGTLPFLYLLNAVVVVIITTVYLRLGRWLSFGGQLVVNLGFLALLTLAYWLALTAGAGRPVIFVLPVLFQVVVNMAQIAFWTLVARLLTLRQSKRLLGPIGAGQWVAIVLTGFLIPTIVRAVGAVNLLLISAAGMAGALLLMAYITRQFREQLDAAGAEAAAPGARQSSRPPSFLRHPYVLLMFGLTIGTWLSFFFVDNIFFNRASARFPDPVELSAFLGLYLAGLGLFTLFINTFVAGNLIDRYGVRVGLLVLPTSLLLVTGAFSVVGTIWGVVPLLFWLATLNRVLDLSFQFSIDQSAQTVLYQPLPPLERTRIQTIDNGIVRMIAVGAAGALLLLLNRVFVFDVVQLAYMLLLIVVGWLVVVVFTARAYPQMLAQALARRRLSGITVSLGDPATVNVLKEALHNPSPGPVLYALGLLAEERSDAVAFYLPDLLKHPSPSVRIESLRRIEQFRLLGAESAVRSTAEGDPDAEVRSQALRALAAIGGDPARAMLLDLIVEGREQERLGALVGLLLYAEDGRRTRAADLLTAFTASADPAQRRLAALVLGQVAPPSACDLLAHLLKDDDDRVCRAALQAQAHVRCPDLWPRVIDTLSGRRFQSDAVAALVAGYDDALPAVEAALSRPGLRWDALVMLVRACGRTGSDGAVALLLRHLDHPGDTVRTEIFQALSYARYQATGKDRARLEGQVAAEVEHAAWMLAGVRDCQNEPALPYLRRVLEDQVTAARRRVFLLLSCLYPRETMLEVEENLRGDGSVKSTGSKQSYALEMLDVTLPPHLKALVMPLAEPLPSAVRLQRLSAAFAHPALVPTERVRTLIAGNGRENRWLHITDIYAAGRIRCAGPDIEELLDGYKRSDDPVLRETAAWTLASIRTQSDTLAPKPAGEKPMLSTVEKVIILKDVDLFAETPDELLAEVAELLAEVEVSPEEIVFGKGDSGDSLYIIVSGEVRVHDEDYLINILGESDVFGEMALLDPEPRMASVTAQTDSLLLRLDQEPFYELMDTRSEVARGIIRVLTARLRQRVHEVGALRSAMRQG